MSTSLQQRLVWKQQADAISCGPAALSMLVQVLGNRQISLHPFEVREMMGVNTQTGTTHKEMARGLNSWGLAHRRMEPCAHQDGRLQRLQRWLEAGNPALLRVMRHGGKHWVAALGMDAGRFIVADPASGVEWLTGAQLEDVMAPRGWEIWAIPRTAVPHTLEMDVIGVKGAGEALGLCAHALGYPTSRISRSGVRQIIALQADWNLSVALRVNGVMTACYVLRERSLAELAKTSALWGEDPRVQALARKMEGMRTVWGVALAGRQDSRGLGYGRLVRTVPGQLGFDASFGLQLKELDNHRDWAKVRPWRVDLEDMWLTAGPVERLRPLNPSATAQVTQAEFPRPSSRLAPF